MKIEYANFDKITEFKRDSILLFSSFIMNKKLNIFLTISSFMELYVVCVM